MFPSSWHGASDPGAQLTSQAVGERGVGSACLGLVMLLIQD